MRNSELKYVLYEMSVQEPQANLELLDSIRAGLGRASLGPVLREDFCGTFALAAAWVASAPERRAIGVDLDPEPLAFGRGHHLPGLAREQRRRLRIIQGNVLDARRERADLIVAGNFSFYIFQERELLRRYFRRCRQGLNAQGVLMLEMFGGPGAIEKTRERRTIRRRGLPPFTYVWDQASFDPIARRGQYYIHFNFPARTGRRPLERAFSYDWRIWTVPEVREILREAGFRRSIVFWESEHEGVGTGEYVPSEKGTNDYSWISYVIGIP